MEKRRRLVRECLRGFLLRSRRRTGGTGETEGDLNCMEGYIIILAAVYGAVMGSFLNCAAYRISRGESFVTGHSRCTACGHVLGPLDLVPVLSWVFLRGKCRYCGEKISARYPAAEVFWAVITAVSLWRFGMNVIFIRNYIFLCCLFCLSLVDLETMIIPDEFHLISAGAWAAALPFAGMGVGGIISHVLAGLLFGGGLLLISLVLDRVLGRESLGGGDIKLMAVTGLYLGIVGTLFALILACILGLAVHGMRKEKDRGTGEFPFGPSISAAAGFMLLFGEPLVKWYLGLLGL